MRFPVLTKQPEWWLKNCGTTFSVYGFPQRIHSDKGANFESKLIAELLLVSGVDKSHTTPYHPMGNGQTERFNRTLGNMIRSLPPRAKERWPQMIQTLTFSYNCTTHETTGFAPFYLMFGRIPKLPVDVMFGSALRNEDVQTYDEYVKSLQKDLREAVHIAKGNTMDAQRKQTEGYNKRSKVPLWRLETVSSWQIKRKEEKESWRICGTQQFM